MSGSIGVARPPPVRPGEEEEREAVFQLLDKMEAFKVEGRDKRSRRILRIIGKFFPARIVKPAVLIRYLEERVFPDLLGKKEKGAPFVVVYVHTYVQRLENFPGVSALRSIYESLAPAIRDNLEAVYFVHPGLQSRLFFATFGRFLFSAGLLPLMGTTSAPSSDACAGGPRPTCAGDGNGLSRRWQICSTVRPTVVNMVIWIPLFCSCPGDKALARWCFSKQLSNSGHGLPHHLPVNSPSSSTLFFSSSSSSSRNSELQTAMEADKDHTGSIVGFLREKGFDEGNIRELLKRCKRLEGLGRDRASESWEYLRSVGIQERKLPHVVSRCPKVLALGRDEKLAPAVQCLATLGTKPGAVAAAVVKFPHILSHSVEEKLCPLLAFFQALGVPEARVGKLLLLNPRLISYSIQEKLSPIAAFLSGLGFEEEGAVGRILLKSPYIMGYNVERRLRPTTEFLRSIGLGEKDLRKVAVSFPEVLCRDVDKVLRPNWEFLMQCGFGRQEIAVVVTGYPPVLIKSVENSLKPRMRFLVEVMGRQTREVTEYPEFFRHGLKKSLALRQRVLQQSNTQCSLSEMLGCNQKKFMAKFCAI